MTDWPTRPTELRVFHYSPWYAYFQLRCVHHRVKNLSLFALIYLSLCSLQIYSLRIDGRWESFIIRLDILSSMVHDWHDWLRIFHYSPWYTYRVEAVHHVGVENLSLFALIYLCFARIRCWGGWESFIIRLDILRKVRRRHYERLRIFHYSPWYTYGAPITMRPIVENLSLFALIYLHGR